ncbi:MAG: hypothetical protein DRO95_03225 [Candidatus Altiarchaeales archaeon]|nr:MAG: hypothetical protein DRO95_03225 [Candidatus Altiarchaeales archaeon]
MGINVLTDFNPKIPKNKIRGRERGRECRYRMGSAFAVVDSAIGDEHRSVAAARKGKAFGIKTAILQGYTFRGLTRLKRGVQDLTGFLNERSRHMSKTATLRLNRKVYMC